mgnify:CR=1 FL=1
MSKLLACYLQHVVNNWKLCLYFRFHPRAEGHPLFGHFFLFIFIPYFKSKHDKHGVLQKNKICKKRVEKNFLLKKNIAAATNASSFFPFARFFCQKRFP